MISRVVSRWSSEAALSWILGTALIVGAGCSGSEATGEDSEDPSSESKEDSEKSSQDPSEQASEQASNQGSEQDSKKEDGSQEGEAGSSKPSGDGNEENAEEVPEEFKGKKNPFDSDDAEALKAGKALYDEHCEGCHAKDGTGELPFCPDFTGDKAAKWSAARLCWKVTKGSGDMMPGSEGILSEEEIWQVITYVQAFSAP